MTNTVAITGDTYPLRIELRDRFKGRWNKAKKAWLVPAELADEAQSFVAEHAARKRQELAALEARQREEWKALREGEIAAEAAVRAAERRAEAERAIAEAPIKARLFDSIAGAEVFKEVDHKRVSGLSCQPLSVSLADIETGVSIGITHLCRRESEQRSRRVNITTVWVPVVTGAKTIVHYQWNRAREDVYTL